MRARGRRGREGNVNRLFIWASLRVIANVNSSQQQPIFGNNYYFVSSIDSNHPRSRTNGGREMRCKPAVERCKAVNYRVQYTIKCNQLNALISERFVLFASVVHVVATHTRTHMAWHGTTRHGTTLDAKCKINT